MARTYKRKNSITMKMDSLQMHEQIGNRIKAAFVRLTNQYAKTATEPIIQYRNGKFITSNFLLNRGIILCPKCGYPQPIENEICKELHCSYPINPSSPEEAESHWSWPIMPVPPLQQDKKPIPIISSERTRVKYVDAWQNSKNHAIQLFKEDPCLIEIRSLGNRGTKVLFERSEMGL